ncbi:MAG TPA: hypothetical protein VGJ92_12515 [Methanocella sp.]|jgi:hypothetical protein
MLRKTAVVAVLIIMLSSFTLGSTVRVQTVAAAGNEGDTPQQFTQEYGLVTGWHSVGYNTEGHRQITTGVGVAGTVQAAVVGGSEARLQTTPAAEDIFWPPAAGNSISPVRVTTGIINDGKGQQVSDLNFTSVVFYLDDLQPEITTWHVFSSPGSGPSTGLLPVWPRPVPGIPGGNLTLKGKVAMQWPGAEPELFDFRWEKERSKTAENGSLAIFKGHMIVPGRGISLEKASTFAFANGTSAGAIEISSDMVVDLANLPVEMTTPVNASQADDVYNNQIAAGETKWHAVDVDSAVKSVNVDLKWQDPDGKLRLMIYTPDGKVLGPYYDDADGQTDSRINLNIANPSGVASGEWHLKVTDLDTLGSDDYYVKTY